MLAYVHTLSRDFGTQIYVWLLNGLQDIMQVSSPDMVVACVGILKAY